ncbi:MAG TPA: hypothetical protein VK147_08810 [Candidatus Didemnitutus sp.]|nr:hypothetical protein [Candidatus Didemnitutus sp.]
MARHVPPHYYGYKGGFDNVNICSECGTRALYEDMHQVDPCPYCGGEVREGAVGKWTKISDTPIERKWWEFWKVKLVSEYRWVLKNEKI